MRAGAGALACCGWVGLAALARAVIINAPGKCAGFLQQLSSGRSDSPLIVMRWLFPVPRERTTGAIATSHKGASSAIPSFPEPTGRLRAAAHTAAGTTSTGSPVAGEPPNSVCRAYAPGMDPTVTAAAIGVTGTVIVGVIGHWASVRNTSKTLELMQETVELTRRTVELTEQGT